MIHLATPDLQGALCGAEVIGIITSGHPLDCVVCAELREGRTG
jgi:hypothetical protein